MELGVRDIHILQIEKAIKGKRDLLVAKKKDLEKKSKLNDYLSNVKEDYNKYYNYILNEKQQQYNSMLLLKDYLSDIMETDKLVEEQLRSAKHDQKDIILEIDKLKQEIDELIK
jgi:hypothetical protein